MTQGYDRDVRWILHGWTCLPGTPDRPRPYDRRCAKAYLEGGFTLPQIFDALLLATVRRLASQDQPLPPVRSLAYYRPVLEEIGQVPLSDDYRRYLTLKLRQHQVQAAVGQIPAVSHGR